MATSSGPTLYRGDATPATGRTGDLWVKTTESPPVLHICLDDTPTWVELGSMKPTKVTTYNNAGATGTHSITDGTWVRVTCVGGGGGGGGKGGNNPVYAAGGGGGQTISRFFKVYGTSIPYKVGAGGTGGSTSGSNGTAGETTHFGYYVAAEGGGGGGGSYFTNQSRDGGYGGGLAIYGSTVSTSTGDYTVNAPIIFGGGDGNIPGGSGGSSYSTSGHSRMAGYPDRSFGPIYVSSTFSNAGSGGCSAYGNGGVAVMDQNGAAGSGYGGGGAGAGSTTTTDYTGGNGSGGLIIVEEFGVW